METQNFNTCDNRYQKYVGWAQTNTTSGSQCLFEPETLENISKKISELLEGVHPNGKTIVVTHDVICNVLSTITINCAASRIGDIYTRYYIPQNEPGYFTPNIINRTIETIVSYIKAEMGMVQTNESLSIWNSILGGQNELGLLPHSKIKLREKHPQYMAFNMNY